MPPSSLRPSSRTRRAGRNVHHESGLPGVRRGHLVELLSTVGLRDVRPAELSVRATHDTFESWWTPFELGVGPAGAYLARLEPERRAALRERCRATLRAPFTLEMRAWAARGTVADAT